MSRILLALILLFAGPASGAPAEDHWGAPPSAEFARASELAASGRFDEALPILMKLAEETPGDADLFNLLGFAHRKTGDPDGAMAHYQRALRLSPDHRGALAYQGELFLMRGDPASAEANLARLATLCPGGCAEMDELARALSDWKAARD